MKKCCYVITLLLLSLTATGCITGRGKNDPKPNPAAYHYQMGLSYLGELNYSSALFDLTEAEKLEPENPDILYNLARAYVGKRRPDLAEARFLKAILLKPSFSAARNDLGVAYLELKRWDSAIQQFKIVKDDLFYDNNENAAINLALAYLGKGDYSKAMEELQAVIERNPRNPAARLSLGRVWFALENTEKAIIEYNKALAIYNDYGDAHYYLGLAQLKLNRINDARSSFKEAVRLIPGNENGRAALVYLERIK